MKHKNLTLFALCLMVLWLGNALPALSFAPQPALYQLKVYHLKDGEQEARLDRYLQNAYLPALHRAGIDKVGVFKPIESADSSTPAPAEKLVYVFVPLNAAEQILKLDQTLLKDKQYLAAGKEYIEAAHDNPFYNRIETILIDPFKGMPVVKKPNLKAAPGERVYELRSYEAATEKLHQNKVAMFNNGEIEIFDKLGFNPVFYGRVVAGSKMPNLMYMTTFENMAEREAHWKAFGEDPDWKKLSAMPEYAHNFLRADIHLLRPTAYSDL
ncbi:NIPSNAP protein [Pontibacter ummariensis]|uniref:NIPSNAP protein n=1 Tax=Pontibacter ummariensis TaxID=1610492 RepID=A0A239D2H4_9BACT|nr:NIPSNAP family protein [Pontibacter ummariensis]PRY14209.1 NIPSNAP protein [Pontibacter ummariensis]SNS26507.1 NIPSNAP protein [Pontibacter ummariensis]